MKLWRYTKDGLKSECHIQVAKWRGGRAIAKFLAGSLTYKIIVGANALVVIIVSPTAGTVDLMGDSNACLQLPSPSISYFPILLTQQPEGVYH